LALGITKISIVFLSISLIASFGLSSNQAFAGFETCEECDTQFDQCTGTLEFCRDQLNSCRALLQFPCTAVGGEFIGIETTSVLVAGAQYTAAWMIPVIVSAIGIGIVIARKF